MNESSKICFHGKNRKRNLGKPGLEALGISNFIFFCDSTVSQSSQPFPIPNFKRNPILAIAVLLVSLYFYFYYSPCWMPQKKRFSASCGILVPATCSDPAAAATAAEEKEGGGGRFMLASCLCHPENAGLTAFRCWLGRKY